MTRIPVNPELLTWAHKRACLPGRQAGLESLALAGPLHSGATTPEEGAHE
ncbi:MAG: hypothetical protein K0B16_08775 [Burkholderiaceae bacterium]|nr:hypothetical protein [Burkholderiaceae bacterium]